MIAEPYQSRMTVEEYLALDRASEDVRYEYIDGIVTMLAGGSVNHSGICANIIGELIIALRGKPCRVFTSDLKVSVSASRYVYPDVSVSCDQRDLQEKGDILYSPSVVIEVLSPSTESRDRREKFTYYRGCPSIQEYVLVSTGEQAVDVYRRASEELWTIHLFGPSDVVELKSISVTVPIAAFYENVRF